MSRASATAGPRILVAGLYHETNTFLPDATPLADFEERAGAALLAAEGDGSPLGCALEEARARGWDVVPAIDLRATPSGTVEDAVVARFRAGLAAAAAEATPVDGVLLILHGAMVSESFADVEGEVLRHLRALPGLADVPVVAVLDLHANVSDAMADLADALVVYRENPHTDAGETGRRAARLLDRLARSGERMETLCARPPVVWPPTGTATAADPMRALEAMAREAEARHPSLAEVGALAGFSFADVPEAGVGFTLSFPRGDAAAEREASVVLGQLCAAAWERRAEGNVVGLPLAEVVRRAAAHAAAGAPGGPLVIAEPADNIGAGAPGDRTALLGALLEAGVGGVAAAVCDPGAVAALLARAALPGETTTVRLPIGGKVGGVGEGTLVLDVTLVRAVPDGRFRLEDPHSHLASMGGDSFDMGPCAVVRSGGATLLLTSRRTPPFDLGQWRAAGVDPEKMAVIVAKAAVAHRRVYDPIAGAHLTAETPGPCASDLTALPYRNLRRPVYPLDPNAASGEGFQR